jgi:hypothetical protein
MLLNLIIFKFIGVFEDINNRLVNILSQKIKNISKKFVRYIIIVSLTQSKLAKCKKWTQLTEKLGDTHTRGLEFLAPPRQIH